MQELNYDFKRRHWQVHKPGRRFSDRKPYDSEILIDDSFTICNESGEVSERAAADLQDYFWKSMDISLKLVKKAAGPCIVIRIDETLETGFVIDIDDEKVIIGLSNDADAFRAVVYMEDCMNLEGLPVLQKGRTVRKPLYKYRQVHSGCGIDDYPDEELCATVHAGYDTIVVFVKDFDKTAAGWCDINDIIQRAKAFGLKTHLYNYMGLFMHPDDPGIQEKADALYGELFRRYPDAVSVGMVGESLEFPSKDPHTTGKHYWESVIDGIPDTRVSPGWYPCEDYPAYLSIIEKAVHKAKPDARVTFSTYNWSCAPAELRRNFLSKFPKGMCMGGIVYENSGMRKLEGLDEPCRDYSICRDEPSEYFKTEAAFCKEFGIPCGGNVNTAGVGWDFGCVPYVPAPQKLLNRMKVLRKARYDYGMESHYCTHHYGWWDCVSSDLGKWSSWEDFEPDYDELLKKIAIRDYGCENAGHVLKAWETWSKAADYYVAAAEDQYGPWRVGAAYPFIFQPNLSRTMLNKEIQFPTKPGAHFGHLIIKTYYQPYDTQRQAPGFLRFPAEIRSLEKMLVLWDEGLNELKEMKDLNDFAEQVLALGTFIRGSIVTTINIKKWWMGNLDFQRSSTADEALERLDGLFELLTKERENAKSVIPAVKTDSRLGWEASMEYVADPWHIEWKLRQLDAAEREMKDYQAMLLRAKESTC